MERKTRIPNTRLNRFYDEEDFRLELDMATELIEEDMNFTVVLFRIDRVNTQVDDVYWESNTRDVRFRAPVELKVILSLANGENKSYSPNGNMRYQDYGNLEFTVLQKQLDDANDDKVKLFGDIDQSENSLSSIMTNYIQWTEDIVNNEKNLYKLDLDLQEEIKKLNS